MEMVMTPRIATTDEWMMKWAGKQVYEQMWKPLLIGIALPSLAPWWLAISGGVFGLAGSEPSLMRRSGARWS